MIGQIGPLVQAGFGKKAASAHLFGGLSGGFAGGLALGIVGNALMSVGLPVSALSVIVIAFLATWAAAVDYRLVPPVAFMDRQTPQAWECALGSTGAAFAWGADLGLGFTTRLPRYSLLTFLGVAVGSGSPIGSALILGAYGLGKGVGVVGASSWRDPGYACALIDRRDQILTTLSVSCALGATGLFLGNLLFRG